VTCSEATPYPPAGQAREWWQRLKNAFGTASSAFVGASLQQLIAAAHLARWGQMLFHQAIPKKRSCVSAFRMTHGYRTRQPAIFRSRRLGAFGHRRGDDRGPIHSSRRGESRPLRPSGGGTRRRGKIAKGRPAGLCRRRNLRPTGRPGRRGTCSNLQLAAGAAAAAHCRRQECAAAVGGRRGGRGRSSRPACSTARHRWR
jgi:hypothetical protein